MRAQLKHLCDQIIAGLQPIFRILVRLPVHIDIWITDQMFLIFLNNSLIGRPSVLGKLFVFGTYIRRMIRTAWIEVRTEYTLWLYHKRNLVHYAQGGRGYLNLGDLSEQERAARFTELTSRLQLFADAYPSIVGYRNGESFLDAGCGKGQNLQFILSRYPRSSYIGFDIDERCLQVASVGVAGSANRSLIQGSILDIHFLQSFEDKSVDHICICGVFSTLLESTIHQTKLTHQRIVDEFVRISRKSIMIIDEMSSDPVFKVEIEQLTRATIRENVALYFEKYQSVGETCMLSYQNVRAVLFKSL